MADSNFVNPYERIWKTRDLRALEPKPIELENNLSSFERGLGRFGQQMKGTGYGLAALASQGVQNVIGENPVTQGITDWGLEGYNQAMAKSQPGAYYAPKIAGVEDIKSPSDALEWGAGMLGEQLPLAASLMLTGGVGGAVARLGANAAVKDIAKAAVGTAVKKGVEQGALKAAEGQLVTAAMRNAASKALLNTTLKGAAVTGFMGTAGLEGGLSFGEAVQGGAAPADAVKTAIAVGGINGALELLTPFVIAKRMGMGEYAKNSIKEIIKTNPDLAKRAVGIAKELGTRAAKGSAEGGLTETITEGLQELTSIAGERWAKNDPLFADLTEQDWSRIKNASAGGLFVGGVLGGAGATLSGPQQAGPQAQPPAQPPVQSPAETPTMNPMVSDALRDMRDKRIIAAVAAARADGDTTAVDTITAAVEGRLDYLREERAKLGPNETYDKAIQNQEALLAQLQIPAQKAPIQEAPAQEPLVQEPPAPVVPAPGEPIRMQQGEEVILTPGAAPTTRVTPTPEEVEALRQRMGPRPETQPTEEMANAQEVQAQTEAEVKPGAPLLQSRPLQRPEAPAPFYSALERVTQEAKQEKAAPAQWESTLDNMVKKGLVKQEELDWSGTKDWLKEQKEPVTKEALLQHVRDNTLEVKETEIGAPTAKSIDEIGKWTELNIDGMDQPVFEWTTNGEEVSYTSVSPRANGKWKIDSTDFTSDTKFNSAEEAIQYANDKLLKTIAPIKPRNTRWTLPGGENQRELVLTVPSIEPFNTNDTTHYGDVGGGRAVAWVRFNDRVDGDGNKTLFLEEVQSKRHQEGNKKGYRDNAPINKNDLEIQDDGAVWGVYYKGTQLYRLPKNDNEDLFDAKSRLDAEIEKDPNLLSKDNVSTFVPNAPFKQTIAGSGQTLSGWAGLAFKRILKYAVENGYDKVAWTTGELQAERYNGAGEEFLKRLYDETLPKEINKYVKKWGTSVENTQIDFSIGVENYNPEAQRVFDVHSVEITPAMRDLVMQGQPLFSKPLQTTQEFKQWSRGYSVIEDAKVGATNTFETGKPFVAKVYHGSESNLIEEFDPNKLGDNTGAASARKGFFFAGDPKTTAGYLRTYRVGEGKATVKFDGNSYGLKALNSKEPKEYALGALYAKVVKPLTFGLYNITDSVRNRLINETIIDLETEQKNTDQSTPKSKKANLNKLYGEAAEWLKQNKDAVILEINEVTPTVYPVYARMSNPMVYDQKGKKYRDTTYNDLIKQARDNGHDGLVILNTYDGGPLDNIFVVFDNKDIKGYFNKGTFDETGRLLESKQPQEPDTTNIPLQDFHANINSIMGEGWLQQAIEAGLVEVIEGKGPNGEAGSWAGDRIRLYTGSMPKDGSPAGVLLHEGKHATFKDILGDSLSAYVKDLHILAKNGNKVAQDAITHAVIAAADSMGIKHNLYDGGTKADFDAVRAIIEERYPGLLSEEELAYFVQHGTESQTGQGFLRRLINQIKAWLAQTRLGQRAKELGIGFELTDGMAVEWAKMGLNRSLAEAKQAARIRARVEKQAATMPASARLGKALETLAEFDPLFSFAGENALTANLSLQQEAALRIKNGENKESVRQDTGWFLNEADGKWRFEIDDSKASWGVTSFENIPESELFGKESSVSLADILNHLDLFKAYPQLKNISVIKREVFEDPNQRMQGWFSEDNLQIGITPYAKNPMSTLLHEVQHVIQMYEGFARGGNEESVWNYLPKDTKENIARSLLEKNNRKIKEIQQQLDIVSLAESKLDLILEYSENQYVRDRVVRDYTAAIESSSEDRDSLFERWNIAEDKLKRSSEAIANELGIEGVNNVDQLSEPAYATLKKIAGDYIKDFTAYKDKLNQDITDTFQIVTKIKTGNEKEIRKEANLFEFYRMLAGETEARLTQARQGMTSKQRDLKSPESMQDYPYDKQIVVMPGTKTSGEVFYSMGIQELRQRLWTDPTDVNQELVNKPGLLQRLRGNFIDFFAEMEKKSKDVYDTYSLLRSKKAGRIEQARQEYYFPLRELIAKSPWSAKEMGDMLAARHIKVDKVNTRLAERASYGFTKDLLKALPKTKQKELQQARVNIKAGKMPDGSDYVDANGNKAVMAATTKQKFMFDLMNKYVQHEVTDTNGRQVLREEWELFKDAAGGFSEGGVGSNKVRTVDDVLQMADRDRAKFDEIANLFDALNRHTLDILEDGGLITAKEHARLLADKSAYAPLRRESYNVNREIELLFQKAGQGGSKQVSTRTGTAALSEPALVLQNALAATEAAAAAAERNLANKELYKVIVADREGWKPWFTIVEKDKYVTHDEDGFLQEKHATASNRADITLINDGKKLVIRPNMHNERAMGFVRAVNNLDAQMLSGPMRVLGWTNQIVRWVNVSASPVFLMMNAVRDPFTALYNIQASKAGEYTKEIFSPKTYKNSFRALKKVFMDGNRDPNDKDVQWVERWELAGGRTSFVETLREMDDTWRSFDAQVARRQGNMKQLMQAKDKWIDGIENLNILFENVMRFSTFKVLIEKGVSEKEAARISQDLTTNFTRRGYKTQMLGTWWLFFNATVQGNYQVLRNLMGSKKVQAMVGGTIVMGLLLDLLGRAIDDDWDKIPEWDKERFIILPVKVGGDFVRIPAPWVYNVVWRTGGLLGEALSGVKKPQDAVLDIAAMTTTVFNPLGKPGSIAQAIAPTGLDPFVQILENKDFAGNPLGPEGFPGAGSKANSELLWSSTPKGYQSIARWVNEFTGGSAVESGAIDLRPADYQLLARFLTGSLGRFMSDATFGVKEALDKGVEGPRDIPVVKEIFSDPYDPLKSQKYHTNIAGIYAAHKLEQMYLKGPDRDLIKLQEVRKDRGEELRMYSQAQDVERQLKSLRVRLKAAQNRDDREREKEIKDRMGKIQERFNERYQQRMG